MNRRILRSLAVMSLAAGMTAAMVTGCSSTESESTNSAGGDVTRMWIEPELVECEGVAPIECMQVAYSEDGPTQLFYDSIAGFDYQEGTSYVIDVEVTEVDDPPADASSLSYTLVEMVEEVPQ